MYRSPVEIDLAPSGANAETTSTAANPGAGICTRVQVVPITGAVPPPGRYYARVVLCKSNTFSVNVISAVLWAGYVTGTEPPSTPNIAVGLGEWVFLDVFSGTGGASTDVLRAIVTMSDESVGTSSFYTQPPFLGPGEIRKFSTTTPAAGAIQGQHVFGAFIRIRLRSVYMTNTIGATPAVNRASAPSLIWKDNGVVFVGQAPVYQGNAAGTKTDISVGLAYVPSQTGTDAAPLKGKDTGAQATSVPGFPAGGFPDVVIIGDGVNAALQFYHPGLNADDALSAANVTYEEWAGPQP